MRFLYGIKRKHLLFGIVALIVLKYFGVFTHLFETNFYTNFHYPYDGDISQFVQDMRNGKTPRVEPINSYDKYEFIKNPSDKCKSDETLRLVLLIKSSAANFNNRIAIRSSWGFEKRFSDVEIRTLFLIGVVTDDNVNMRLENENVKYNDIVQSNFEDNYNNNTIKTMTGFKWGSKFCSNSKFYMFVDDDYYVSVKNVLRFIRNPTNYPTYLENPIITLNKKDFDFELAENVQLYTGFVFVSSPIRNTFSKWHITLEEYPYHMWPPYVTAGAYILSKESFLNMFYASYYTEHFKFDDIYVALLAYKLKIEPYHCEQFHFYKKDYVVTNLMNSYTFTIASHGYRDSGEMLRAWTQQKSLGNA